MSSSVKQVSHRRFKNKQTALLVVLTTDHRGEYGIKKCCLSDAGGRGAEPHAGPVLKAEKAGLGDGLRERGQKVLGSFSLRNWERVVVIS